MSAAHPVEPYRSAAQPCSNRSAHDERPLLSVIIQSFNDDKAGQPQQLVERLRAVPLTMEILVNDDSRNGAAEWTHWLSGANDFYVSSPNIHEIRAYNRLARMARGELLVLLQGEATHGRLLVMNATRDGAGPIDLDVSVELCDQCLRLSSIVM